MRLLATLVVLLVLLGIGGLLLNRHATDLESRALRLYDRWSDPELVHESSPLAATFNDPSGLWIDSTGSLFFSERRASVVRSLVDGQLRVIAGNGRKGFTGDKIPARQSRLDSPNGLAGDLSGNLYISDTANHRIRRVDAAGKITTIAGNGSSGFSGDGGAAIQARLDRPMDVSIGPSGAIYICDWGNHRVRRVSDDGIIVTVAGTGEPGFGGDGGPAELALLNGPYGIWVDDQERVLIADSGNHRIRRIDAEGRISTIAGTGEPDFSGDGGPAIEARFDTPQAVFATPTGSILINDEHNHRIREIRPDGVVQTLVGTGRADLCGDGGAATEACLNDPEDIMMGPSGELYLTDGDNHRIRLVDSHGVIHTIAGSGPIGRRTR